MEFKSPLSVESLQLLALKDSTTLTIATGAVTVAQSYHQMDTEGAAASDDLVTINGLVDGCVYYFRSVNAGRVITVKHGTGNIYAADGEDIVLNSTTKVLTVLAAGGDALVVNINTVSAGGGGGGATGETNVIYVRTWGNDTTGDGSLGTPYATASKAYTEWSAGKILDFGIGSFGAGTFANSGATLYLRGMHSRKTLLGAITTNGASVTIIGDGNITIASIDANGGSGSIGSTGSAGTNGVSVGETGGDGGSGGDGGYGDSGGSITLVRIRVSGDLYSNGGSGGNGGTGGTGGDGGPGDGGTSGGYGGSGGTGGNAGYGGSGGTINTYDSVIFGTCNVSQGSPGSYGSGGSGGSGGSDGGAGAGSGGFPGGDGMSAGGSSDGSINLYRSYLGSYSVSPTVYTDWTYDDGPP